MQDTTADTENAAVPPGSPGKKFNSQFLIVAALFLLSGMSSLVYQVIWTRLLVFVFGSTTFATSTVLSVFMGGLAIGSYFAGRKADRIQKPLYWYGILELVIGVWAVITPVLLGAAIPIYKMCFEALHLNVIAFGLVRYVIAAVILLLPTACMGATLPILARFVTENLEQVGDRVGSLYAINTLGAVLGSIAGGFMLIPSFGLSTTTYIAAAVNVSLTIIVLLISKLPSFAERDKTLAQIQSQELAAPTEKDTKLSGLVIATMASFGISGGLAMIYEVAWTRALLMVIGSTTYAFTVMLSSFLVGIFTGSFICSRFADKLKSPVLWFGLVQVLLCLFGILSLFTFNQLPYMNLLAGNQFSQSPELTLVFRFLLSGFVLLPISLCLGLIFPLAVKICAQDLQRIGSSLGKLYSVNTIGAIIGAFLAGFVIIPGLGSEMTLLATSLANLVLGVFLLTAFSDMKVSIKALTSIACLIIVITCWIKPPQFWDYNTIVAAQIVRRQMLVIKSMPFWESLSLFKTLEQGGKILFYEEGKCANVAVRKLTNRDAVSLITNGHVDASNQSDMQNQAMLGILPLLFKKDQDDVCVVGWGSGVTSGYALRFPIKQMICSEIEPVVLKTSKYFHSVNYKADLDNRTVIEPSDGRNYLLGTSRKFDVIMSEPSNPWQAGVCNLFTKEYFSLCKDSLKPGGVFTMWSQVNEVPTEDLAAVLKSLSDVYPCVYVLDTGDGGDINAVAFMQDTKISYEQVKKNLEIKEVKDAVARFDLATPEDFIARIVVSPGRLKKAVENSFSNTDDRNRLEYDVAKTYENKQYMVANRAWFRDQHGDIWDYIDWGSLSIEQKAEAYLKVARSCLSYFALAKSTRAMDWARESMRIYPSANALSLIAELQISDHEYQALAKTIEEGSKAYPHDGRFIGLGGIAALQLGDYVNARNMLSKSLQLNPDDSNFKYYLALCYSDLNITQLDGLYFPPPSVEPTKVVELLAPAVKSETFLNGKPQALLILGDAYKQLGKYDEAEKLLTQLVSMKPNGYLGWQVLGDIYSCKKEPGRARYCWNKAYGLTTRDLPNFVQTAIKFATEKNDLAALKQIQSILQIAPANEDARELLKVLAGRNPLAAKLLIQVTEKDTVFLQSRNNKVVPFFPKDGLMQ